MLGRLILTCLLLSQLFVLFSTYAFAKSDDESLADYQHIAGFMEYMSPAQSMVSLAVWDSVDKRLVYSQNADALMNGASLHKILTSVAATHVLGKNYRYQTNLYSSKPLVSKSVSFDGDIYIQFSGDPTLRYTELIDLLNVLRKQGITKLKGNVYVVGSNPIQQQASGWVWDDLGICYAAPVSSFIIDKNCVYARLSGTQYHHKATLKVMGNRPIFVDSDAYFVQPSQTKQNSFFDASCNLSLIRKDSNHFTLTGCHRGAKSLPLAIAINEPLGYAQNVIAMILKNKGIDTVNPISHVNRLPESVTLIDSHESAPLPELIDEMLLDSDNLIAEALLQTAASTYVQQTVNFPKTGVALQSIFYDLGIDLSYANIADGSGLSRYNLISANQLLETLKLIDHSEEFTYLRNSFPTSGQSGTLRYKRYFNSAPLKNKVHAKTGSMLGVSNLAGSIEVSSGKRYLFVLIENGISPTLKKQKKANFSVRFLQNLMDTPLVSSPLTPKIERQ